MKKKIGSFAWRHLTISQASSRHIHCVPVFLLLLLVISSPISVNEIGNRAILRIVSKWKTHFSYFHFVRPTNSIQASNSSDVVVTLFSSAARTKYAYCQYCVLSTFVSMPPYWNAMKVVKVQLPAERMTMVGNVVEESNDWLLRILPFLQNLP